MRSKHAETMQILCKSVWFHVGFCKLKDNVINTILSPSLLVLNPFAGCCFDGLSLFFTGATDKKDRRWAEIG